MADYMTYEETVPLVKATHFKDYQFLDVGTVLELINSSVPTEGYGIDPDEDDKDEEDVGQVDRLSPQQIGKLSVAARTLNLSDQKKAAGIDQFVKTNFRRKILETDDTCNNCMFSGVLQQLSNKDFMADNEKGILYNPQSMRIQTVAHVTKNYEEIWPVLKDHIQCSLVTWLKKMLLPSQTEWAMLVCIRHMLKVNKS